MCIKLLCCDGLWCYLFIVLKEDLEKFNYRDFKRYFFCFYEEDKVRWVRLGKRKKEEVEVWLKKKKKVWEKIVRVLLVVFLIL